MGILNAKERILDTIITQEGRKQLAQFGSLRPAYFSITDAPIVYYNDTIVSGSQAPGELDWDETYRFMFESTGLPQDTIIFEADDGGFLNRFPNLEVDGLQGSLVNGQLYLNDGNQKILASNTVFASQIQDILTSSLDAFKKQFILRTPDILDDTERQFIVTPNEVDFYFTKTSPLANNQEASIDHVESLFMDKRLSHLPTFQFLPPVYTDSETKQLMYDGNYVDVGQRNVYTFSQLETDLNALEKKGMMQEVSFTETSNENNVFGQFFEVNGNQMTKLDVIDFGLFSENNIIRHVFFVGKVYVDSYNQATFVNLFTMVFELDEQMQ